MRVLLKTILFGRNRDIEESSVIFNAIAGILNASQSIVFVMLALRLSTVEEAGYLTIAFAIGNLLLTIGKYGIRNYQVTDAVEKYSFYGYLETRKVTTTLMFICGVLYCFFQFFLNYAEIKKIIIIISILVLYLFESYEDVYEAELQRMGRLDVASMIYIIRWGATFIFYGISFLIFHNLIIALVGSCLINGASCIYLLNICFKTGKIKLKKINKVECSLIIKMSSVLCISSFLIMFIVNCPKYIIDIKMSAAEQTYFGIIVMPIFGIELLSNFIFQPYLHSMSQSILKYEYKKFYMWIVKQVIFIFLLTALVIICANWLGIPILSWIYDIDLSLYHTELLLVLAGGGVLAGITYFGVVLTLLRKQKYMMCCYFIIAVLETIILYFVVGKYGIRGAVIAYDVVALLLLIMLLFYILVVLKRLEKRNIIYKKDVNS